MADFMIRFLICNLILSAIIGVLLTVKKIFKNILSARMQFDLWFILLPKVFVWGFHKSHIYFEKCKLRFILAHSIENMVSLLRLPKGISRTKYDAKDYLLISLRIILLFRIIVV